MGLTTVKDSDNPPIAIDDTGATGVAQLVKFATGQLGTITGVLSVDPSTGVPVSVTAIQGPYTSGAPIDLTTSKPLAVGGRARAGMPTPVDTDDDMVFAMFTPWGDLNVVTRSDGGIIEATTVQPNAGTLYSSGDVIGNVLQFSGATLAAGRGGTAVGARCIDKTGTTKQDIYLQLYDASPASPPADNAPVTGLTAANEIAAHPLVATIEFKAANYVRNSCYGTVLGGAFPPMDYHPAGTVLYGVAYFPGTAKAAADGSFWFGIDVVFG
jgi:hypothetical protein